MKPGAEMQLAQRQANDELVAYVAKEQPCGFSELLLLFGGPDGGGRAKVVFQKRLAHLVSKGRLQTINLASKKHWEVAPTLATACAAMPSEWAAVWQNAAGETPWVGTVVPPRQHNVMHGPLYVSEPDTALRTGSLDFKRLQSRGAKC